MVEQESLSVSFEYQFKIFLAGGIVWGILELLLRPLLGLVLPAFLPLLFPFIISIIILVIKKFLPTPGSFLLMGIIAATTQYILSAEIFPSTLIIILAESAIIEIVFGLLRYRPVTFLISGLLISLYNVYHPLIISGYLFEHAQFIRFRNMFSGILGYTTSTSASRELILIIILGFHIVFGLLAGWLALKFLRNLHKRAMFQEREWLNIKDEIV